MRQLIESVIAGHASVADLQLALADTVDDDDPPEIVRAAELVLAEYTGGFRTRENLVEGLAALIAPAS